MDTALRHLLVLRMRGGIRYRLQQFANPRGAAFLLVTLGVIWLILGADTGTPGAPGPLHGAEQLRGYIFDFMPLGLAGACLFTLMASKGPALHFSQNEIDFLFAGPFSRHGLVLYKICAYFAGAVLSAAIFTLLIPRQASTLVAGFTGTLLMLVFIQLSTAALKSLGHLFEGSRLLRLIQPAVLVAFAAGTAVAVYGALISDWDVLATLLAVRHSALGSALLAPFTVFAQVFLARDPYPDLVLWAGGAFAIDLGLMLVVVALYGRGAEHALTESRHLSKRWARMRGGASFWASSKTTGRSLRRAPWLGGAGPIAWRQAINALRNCGRVIGVFFLIALIIGLVVGNAASAATVSGIVGFVYFFIAFVAPRSLACDFRGDLAAMELYKALPLAPWRICAGQFAVPVLVTSALQLTMILSALPFADAAARPVLVGLTVFTVPASLLLFGLENLIFLLFPMKLLPIGRVDFEFLGRTLIDFIVKTVLIALAAAAALATGYAALRVTGGSWLCFVLGAWLTLTPVALATLPLSAFAFRRFRVSETIG